jgi:hypothetical protein
MPAPSSSRSRRWGLSLTFRPRATAKSSDPSTAKSTASGTWSKDTSANSSTSGDAQHASTNSRETSSPLSLSLQQGYGSEIMIHYLGCFGMRATARCATALVSGRYRSGRRESAADRSGAWGCFSCLPFSASEHSVGVPSKGAAGRGRKGIVRYLSSACCAHHIGQRWPGSPYSAY